MNFILWSKNKSFGKSTSLLATTTKLPTMGISDNLYGKNKLILTKESHKSTINSSLSLCPRVFL